MSVLSGKTDDEKLKDLSSKNYKFQSIWFLNAFWNSFGKAEAENIWTFLPEDPGHRQGKRCRGQQR
jgi:hypothetical protein